MSAAAKRLPEPTPAPFASPERAALGAAIAAAADVGARRGALEKARLAANADVMKAISLAEAAEAALAEAQGNAAKHLVAKARGTAGPPPVTVREARAAAIAAQDALDECRATREALKAELTIDESGAFARQRVEDAARAVIRSEMQQRAIALAERVAGLQRQLVAAGSALQWLASAGVFPSKQGAPHGQPADDAIRSTVGRMQSTPVQWAAATTPGEKPFAQPTGALAWQAAFEALKRDASAPLPMED